MPENPVPPSRENIELAAATLRMKIGDDAAFDTYLSAWAISQVAVREQLKEQLARLEAMLDDE